MATIIKLEPKRKSQPKSEQVLTLAPREELKLDWYASCKEDIYSLKRAAAFMAGSLVIVACGYGMSLWSLYGLGAMVFGMCIAASLGGHFQPNVSKKTQIRDLCKARVIAERETIEDPPDPPHAA